LHRTLGIAVRTTNDHGEHAEPAIYTAIQREQKEKSKAEEARILYVAMTGPATG